jgi:hypothetical protein
MAFNEKEQQLWMIIYIYMCDFSKDATMAYMRVLTHPSHEETEENKENRSQDS